MDEGGRARRMTDNMQRGSERAREGLRFEDEMKIVFEKWINVLQTGRFPTRHFTTLEPQNPSIGVS